MNKRLTTTFALCGTLALGATACGDDTSGDTATASGGSTQSAQVSGNLSGAGSSAQAAAQEAWIAGFQSRNDGATIAYDPVGSGGGREQFVAGGVAFAGSDSALADEELTGAQKRCGGPDDLIELPVYVSPIAVAYNLDGVEDLQLSPETLAKIMKGDVTQWDDAAIKADNPDADLPGDRITVVHRSDESGTTENFTDYLHATAPDVWTDEADQVWPVEGQEAAEGTSGVVGAIKQGSGTIGYADESQTRDLGQAAIGVGDEYVKPSAEAAAKIFAGSDKTDDPGQFVFTYKLDRTQTEAGLYPISLVSYGIACTKYDKPETADLVKGYLGYVVSPEGQKAAQENAGSAPLPQDVTNTIQPAIDAIGAS